MRLITSCVVEFIIKPFRFVAMQFYAKNIVGGWYRRIRF